MAHALYLVCFATLSLSALAVEASAGLCTNGVCTRSREDETSLLQRSVSIKTLESGGNNKTSHTRRQKASKPGTTLPSSAWCGPGQDPTATGDADNWCVGKYPADWACRRHDACAVATTDSMGIPHVSCECDHDLNQAMHEVPANAGWWSASEAIAFAYDQKSLASLSCIADIDVDEPECMKAYAACQKKLRAENREWAIHECASEIPDKAPSADDPSVMVECFVYRSGEGRYATRDFDFGYRQFGYKPMYCEQETCKFPCGVTMSQKEMRDSTTSWPDCTPNPR